MIERLTQLFEHPLATRLTTIAIGISLVLVVAHFVRKAFNRTITDSNNKYKARKAVSIVSYVFMVVVILMVYSDKLGNIGVALGVTGAGIAFALQELIVSFAGWLNIMLTGIVKVGQRVKIGDVKGDIVDIGILSTTVMEIGDWVHGDLYNGRIVSVGNSFVFKSHIYNYSAEFPFLWDELQIPIRTESDHQLARDTFKGVLDEVCGDYAASSLQRWKEMTNKLRLEDARVEPMITLVFDENWITFTLRYVVDYKRRRGTKDEIYSRILNAISKLDGKVEIATSTLEVTSFNSN